MANGYVRRVISDGYVMAGPYNFLIADATYDIVRNGNVIAPGLAVVLGGISWQVVLVSKSSETPVTLAQVGDLIVRVG